MHGEIRKWPSTKRINWDGWWRCVCGLLGYMWASSLLVLCHVWRPSNWSPSLNAFVGLWMFCGLRKNMQSPLWSPWIPWLRSQICGTQTNEQSLWFFLVNSFGGSSLPPQFRPLAVRPRLRKGGVPANHGWEFSLPFRHLQFHWTWTQWNLGRNWDELSQHCGRPR